MTAATFAELQAAFERRGVAVYPVGDDKRPAIKGYYRVGAEGSRQLALKFAAATAAGFIAGRRNRLVVVDIDSTDDRLADEVRRYCGPTPLEVVTPSGGRHLYYRFAGEPRRIRALTSTDILGAGGVVAAGSVVARGKYEIARGTLEDLDRLPPIRRHEAGPASNGEISPITAERRRVPKGRRNAALFAYCSRVVARCDDFDQLLDAACTWAEGALAQLPGDVVGDNEIVKTCRSVWSYRGGRKRMTVYSPFLEGPQWAALASNTDALALFAYLSAENGDGAEFWIADGLAEKLGWPRRLIPAARRELIQLKIVEQVRPAGNGMPALYRWAVSHD